MQQFFVDEMQVCIEEVREYSQDMANSLVNVLEHAKRGNKESEKMVKGIVLDRLMPEYLDEFEICANICDAMHEKYSKSLEVLKEEHWGNFMAFSKSLLELNRVYEAMYKNARNANETYKQANKISYEVLRTARRKFLKKGNIDEFSVPEDMDEEYLKEIYGGAQFVPKTSQEATDFLMNEREGFQKQMDEKLKDIRKNMRDDFSLGEIAKEVILCSQTSKETQANKGE